MENESVDFEKVEGVISWFARLDSKTDIPLMAVFPGYPEIIAEICDILQECEIPYASGEEWVELL